MRNAGIYLKLIILFYFVLQGILLVSLSITMEIQSEQALIHQTQREKENISQKFEDKNFCRKAALVNNKENKRDKDEERG